MPGEELTKTFGKDFLICGVSNKGFKTVLIVRGFGLRLKLKKNWKLETKKTLRIWFQIIKRPVLPSLSIFANKESSNTAQFKLNKASVLPISWIGTIPTTRCQKKTTI